MTLSAACSSLSLPAIAKCNTNLCVVLPHSVSVGEHPVDPDCPAEWCAVLDSL